VRKYFRSGAFVGGGSDCFSPPMGRGLLRRIYVATVSFAGDAPVIEAGFLRGLLWYFLLAPSS